MKTVKAIKRHPYAQRMREPGQTYEAIDEHADLLEKLGQVKIQAPARVVKKPIGDASPIRTKRIYRRRDMEAGEVCR